MKKSRFNLVPGYSILPLILVVVWNQLVYCGAMYITRDWYHYNVETALDKNIPFLPWTISIYLGCYLFWIINYLLCARQEKSKAYRFLFADILAKTVCLICFLVFPSTNIRPEVVGNSIWHHLMRMLYSIDQPSNLFPSIHCLVSWFCYIGIRKNEDIPICYRNASCLMAIAVCISTLTTKQHVIIDVVGGVLLAEVCYWITGKYVKNKAEEMRAVKGEE